MHSIISAPSEVIENFGMIRIGHDTDTVTRRGWENRAHEIRVQFDVCA